MSRLIPLERAERMTMTEAKAWMIIMGEAGRPGEKRMKWDFERDLWAIDG